MPELLEFVNCPYCNLNDGSIWAKENGFNAIKCNNCNFIYVNNRPNRSIIQQSVETGLHSYLSHSHSKISRRVKPKIRLYKKRFKTFLSDVWLAKNPVSWLDVGAGYGEIIQAVEALAPQNSYVEGIDPMKPKVNRARKLGLNVIGKNYLHLHSFLKYNQILYPHPLF